MQKLFGTQRAITIVVVSLVFAVAFPAYFSMMGSMVDVGASSSAGASGKWQVNFTTDVSTIDDSVLLSDGETHDSVYTLDRADLPEGQMIAYVNISIGCNDNDDPGPGFSDNVQADMDVSGVEGDFADDSGSGTCNGASVVAFDYAATAGWSGTSYVVDDVSKADIQDKWNDNGTGDGEWLCQVTLEVNSPPGIGGFVDNDEDVTITWTVTTYKLEITAAPEE